MNMKKKKLFSMILAFIMVFTTGFTAQAAEVWPSFNSSKLIKTYTISTGNNTTAYSNSNLKSKIGTIYASDELYIESIGKNSDGIWYCKLTYPTSKGRKTGYVALSTITKATEPSEKGTASTAITTYRRASSSQKAGSMAKGDIVYKLATSGSYVQVLYNIGSASNPSGWRIAWITSANWNKYVTRSNTSSISNGQYVITTALNGSLALDVENNSFNNGTNIQLYSASQGNQAQIFTIESVGNGYYRIVHTASGKVLDVAGGVAGHVNLQLYQWNGTKAQLFRFIDAGNGYYYIQNALGYYVDVNSGVARNYQNVWVYTGNQTPAQKWKLTAYTTNNTNVSSGYIINGVNIGYKAGDYFTDNGKACTDHGTKGIHSYTNEKACNCICTYNGKSLGAVQCFGFARYVQTKLYGVNSYSSSSQFCKVSNSNVAAGKLTASKIKTLVQLAGVGAHIRTNGNQHSMIIADITDTGFTIIQCNGSNNKEYSGYCACRIGTYTYTWQSYVNSTYGQRGLQYIEKIK